MWRVTFVGQDRDKGVDWLDEEGIVELREGHDEADLEPA